MVGLRCFTQHQTCSCWELMGSAQVGNTWRTTGDVKGSWPAIMDNLDGTVGLGRYARPGAWNDADLLEVWCLGPVLHSCIGKGLEDCLQSFHRVCLGLSRSQLQGFCNPCIGTLQATARVKGYYRARSISMLLAQ